MPAEQDKRRIFISDLHLSSDSNGGPPDSRYAWTSQKGIDRLVDFLEHLRQKAQAKELDELILLGDILDTWVFPHNVVPPHPSRILGAQHNAPVMEQLRQISELARLFWFTGNHDMDLSARDVTAVVPKAIFGTGYGNDRVFRFGRARAEHGSAHALFCAPDPTMRARLPVGYFVSRLSASAVCRQGRSYHRSTIVDDILELLGPQTIGTQVVEALAEEAGLKDSDTIIMPEHLWAGEKVEIRRLKDLYADLYARWAAQKGAGNAFKALVAEIGWLGDIADNLCKRGGTNLVVFGHSHDAEVDKDSWFVDDRIYANTGAWIDHVNPPSFVETWKLATKRKHQVRLYNWAAGKATLEAEELVDG